MMYQYTYSGVFTAQTKRPKVAYANVCGILPLYFYVRFDDRAERDASPGHYRINVIPKVKNERG